MALYLKKLSKVLILVLIVSFIFSNAVLASEIAKIDIAGTFNGAIDSNATNSSEKIQSTLLDVLTAVRIAGIAIALVILVIIGIKIMIASPSEKANIKQYAMNYVIGAFILIGATGILTVVQNFAKQSFK